MGPTVVPSCEKQMKRNTIATLIVALAMALAIVVPVFAATSNPFAVVNNGEVAAPVVDTPAVEDLSEAPAVEDIGEAPAVKAPEYAPVTCPVPVQHVCTISKAFATHHVVDCECGEYSYFMHSDLVEEPVNDFFHKSTCACGYTYSENHSFATTYNATSHKEVCVDCGYAKPEEEHLWENDFWSHYHDVQCSKCGYLGEHHVGVSFENIDDTSCQASCRQCGIVEVVAHEFYDFECDNCHYEVRGYSYGIVEDIRKVEDGYRVRFLVNGNSHRITLENVPDFNEGDFVEIDHYGNVIFDITVMVDVGVVQNPESFSDYIYSNTILEDGELTFDDIVIDEIDFENDFIYIDFESGKRCMGLTYDYVVYDLMNGEMSELLEGYAYLSFSIKGRMYFICIW